MKEEGKTKELLLNELAQFRRRIAELEKSEHFTLKEKADYGNRA